MEIRNANIIFSKNGNGFLTTKITLPVGWVKELGASVEDKEVIITFNNKKIEIIKKEDFNMKRIISNGELADLILEKYRFDTISKEYILRGLDAERSIEDEENVEIDVEKYIEECKLWLDCVEESNKGE